MAFSSFFRIFRLSATVENFSVQKFIKNLRSPTVRPTRTIPCDWRNGNVLKLFKSWIIKVICNLLLCLGDGSTWWWTECRNHQKISLMEHLHVFSKWRWWYQFTTLFRVALVRQGGDAMERLSFLLSEIHFHLADPSVSVLIRRTTKIDNQIEC